MHTPPAESVTQGDSQLVGGGGGGGVRVRRLAQCTPRHSAHESHAAHVTPMLWSPSRSREWRHLATPLAPLYHPVTLYTTERAEIKWRHESCKQRVGRFGFLWSDSLEVGCSASVSLPVCVRDFHRHGENFRTVGTERRPSEMSLTPGERRHRDTGMRQKDQGERRREAERRRQERERQERERGREEETRS